MSTNEASGSGPRCPGYSAQVVNEETRPQAGPLPSKRGELGFMEGVHTPTVGRFQGEMVVLPARHPADRDHAPSHASTPGTGAETDTSTPPTSTPASTSPTSPSSDSIAKSRGIFGFFAPKKQTTFGGVRTLTLCLFAVQFVIFAGTAVGWAFAGKQLNAHPLGGEQGSSSIFVHVVFGLAALVQLVFLERRLYRLRGERYTHLHPGEVLPRFRANSPGVDSATIAFAPWNRPPLPTYAAALTQSGVGTGDVEDNLIAAPPPPAYGNTRGSTLLLAGYLSATQRAERPRSELVQPGSSHVSYVISEEPSQKSQEVERSVRREETLNRLEAHTSTAVVP